MQFQKYIFAGILLSSFSIITACKNENEICNYADDRCEDHCELAGFLEFQKNKPICNCKKGFARSNNGICIPNHKCVCSKNEISTINSNNMNSCDYICKCRPDYYRKNGVCVLCEHPIESREHCIKFNKAECTCSKCDDTCELHQGYCRQKKCTITCNQGEIKDQKTCTCKHCPNGQIACNGKCMNYPKYCSMFQVNQCKCLQCEKGYILDNGICVPEPQPVCPPKETDYCGNKCPRTCAQPSDNNICEVKCHCVCANGLVRNETGQCVHPSQCTCKPNEVHGKYDITCIPTCTNPNPNNCASLIKIGCHCIDGLVWDTKSKKCVRFEDCPSPICPKNEEYLSCGSACPPTCDVPAPEFCTEQCVSGCFCKPGFVRDLNSNECVPIKNCSCSFDNTQFCLCGPKEPATCHNPSVLDYDDTYCEELSPGCYCTKGTIRDTRTGQCVKPEHCSCERANEVYSTCGSVCEPTCMEPIPLLCPRICKSGCFCENGFVRNELGDCVLLKECACPPNEINSDKGCICRPGFERDLKCGKCVKIENLCNHPNEEFSECGSHCPLSCSDMNPKMCILSCKVGCFCTNGTIRDDNGLCVEPEECCKLRNEAYFKCYREHPKSDCKQGCFCINGTVRDPINGQCIPNNSGEHCDI